MESPPKSDREKPGTVRRVLRLLWQVCCAVAGAVIIGILVGAKSSSLWLGVAAAVPGAIVGWFFGRYVSPLDFFATPIGGHS
jgi:hypothetical protein